MTDKKPKKKTKKVLSTLGHISRRLCAWAFIAWYFVSFLPSFIRNLVILSVTGTDFQILSLILVSAIPTTIVRSFMKGKTPFSSTGF